VKVTLSLNFFTGGWCAASGEVNWPDLVPGEKKENGSVISSSGLVQLPPSEGNDSMLPREEMDESENPEEDVGLLEVSLWLA
jgi:hypothetical protein